METDDLRIKSVIALTDGTPQPVLRALAPYGAMTVCYSYRSDVI